MNLLAFYTAGDPASVALAAGGGERTVDLERGAQFERLLPTARRLLREAGLAPAGLDGVAVARGPGSFTGLRVGAGAALGLCRAADLPLYAVATPQIWAAAALADAEPGARCGVVLDAGRGELYLTVFRAAGELSAELVEGPLVLDAEEALERLGTGGPIVGDGRPALLRAGLHAERSGFARPPEPLALWLARLVARDPRRHLADSARFELAYVREPQAVAIRAQAGPRGGA